MSTVVLPKANHSLSRMMDRVSLTLATSLIRPRVFNEEFPNIVFYVDDLAVDKQQWSRVFLVDNTNPGSTRAVVALWELDQRCFETTTATAPRSRQKL